MFVFPVLRRTAFTLATISLGSKGFTTYSCNSGYSYTSDEKEALNHSYDEPAYIWNEDYSECVAKRVCTHDSSHVETEIAKVSIIKEDASCGRAGQITYTATFTNEAFKTQTHVQKIEALFHKYGDVIYNWSEDYTSCTALRICEHDSRHIETETVKASIEKVEAECEKEGSITYTASFSNTSFKTQTHFDVIEAKSHEYSEVVYNWNENHTECTASRTCKNNLNHIEVETVKATIETIDAVCGEAGTITYTANFENVVFETQTYQETVEALDHIYGEASYNWNEDYTKCTATAVCLLDSNHVYSETVDVASNIINPTCEEEGSITYTAVFENEIFATQTYVEKIDSLSHSYGEVEYTWNEDHTECTASMTCSLDARHVHSETVDVSVSTIESTCEEEGSITYTAVFESEEFETQTYVEIIKEKGHEYDEGVITKEATEDEEGEMTYTCSHCGHSYIESIEKLPPSIEEPPLEEEPIFPEPDLDDEIDNNKGEEVAIVTTAVTVSSVSLGGALWFVFKFLIKLK